MSEWQDSGYPRDRRPWEPEEPVEEPVQDSDAPGSLVATGRIWPVAVALSLFVVVCVNLAFVYIAVTGADEVVPSYVEEER